MTTTAAAIPPAVREELVRLAGLIDREPQAVAAGARDVLVGEPDCVPAHRLLGAALRRLGQKNEAESADNRAIAIASGAADLVEARRLLEAGEHEQAEQLVRARLRIDPSDAAAVAMLGGIATSLGFQPEAEELLRRALHIAPGFKAAQLGLAQVLHRRNRTDEALVLLDQLIERDPDDLGALALKHHILHASRRFDDTLEVDRMLLARDPGSAIRWLNHAFVLKTVGKLDESIDAYRHSLELDPAQGGAWWSLANLKTVKFSAADVISMEQALHDAAEDTSRMQLHFALGKGLGDLGRFAESFGHYAEGNRMRRQELNYDPALVTADVSRVEALFSPQFVRERQGSGSDTRDPIFIIGMHRAGSTLVEQILASHPLVEGTEELLNIQGIAARIAGSKGQGSSWLDDLPLASVNELRALGERYLQTTRPLRKSDRPYFTDKMPGNWLFVGLIHLILPNARIVDVRRHPLGCCFANFAQYYPTGLHFAFDLNDLGLYYRDYVRMLSHFDSVLPNRVHRVFYEDLVGDLETEVRRLLDYVGLPFDDACLRFYENPRAVMTPSSEQVRRPINREGMETWRNYEPWLGPLKDALGAVLERYPEVPKFRPD